MAFDALDPRMKKIAECALAHCKQKFGNNGVRLDEAIDDSIAWRPTFQCKPTVSSMVAVEVIDNLYPEVLKGAAHDISYFDVPIAVYQVCSLDAYQKDTKQVKVNLLRQHGFGIITVDDDGLTTVQHPAVPLAQHIPDKLCESDIKPLTSKLKVCFRNAHSTYRTNIGQGLQQAGQIVEAMVVSLGKQAAKQGHITPAQAKGKVSDVIDHLYESKSLKNHRAALGAARAFMKEYRNTVSHPSKTAKQAAMKMRKCRDGFREAIQTADKLHDAAQKMGYRISVIIT